MLGSVIVGVDWDWVVRLRFGVGILVVVKVVNRGGCYGLKGDLSATEC